MTITAKQQLTQALKSGQFVITFKKVDGSLRVIRGSLMPELLPPVVETVESAPKRPVNKTQVIFYDLDKSEWRSFKIENLVSMSLVLPTVSTTPAA